MPNINKLDVPICFISGAKNECYLPESTEQTFNLLKRKFPEQQYIRHVIPEYGHIDCIFGRNAAEDVYPLVLKHLDETAVMMHSTQIRRSVVLFRSKDY
jgi:cholesterol oxidase